MLDQFFISGKSCQLGKLLGPDAWLKISIVVGQNNHEIDLVLELYARHFISEKGTIKNKLNANDKTYTRLPEVPSWAVIIQVRTV